MLWSHLKKRRTLWWINFFKDLCDRGVLLDGNTFHMECLWFCFNEVIQQDLNFVKMHWNTHHIRPSRYETVSGKPDELFFLSERHGVVDQLRPIAETQMEDVISQNDLACSDEDNDYQEYFKYVCDLESLSAPKDWHESLNLFHYLITLAD